MSPLPAQGPILRAMLCCALFVTGLVFSPAGFSQTSITTVAGMADQAGFSGDGGTAIQAKLYNPVGVCFDGSGNMYIADCLNNRVRKVDASTGVISTIAGTGTAGFSGDGGPAVAASLNHPMRVLADAHNHLFIVDYNNLRVRMLDFGTGVITTIAGDGTENYVDGGLAASGGILPFCLTLDKSGALYISQHAGALVSQTTNIISKLDISTGRIVTVAGSGMRGFAGDGGPAINAQLFNPAGIVFDAAGNLYIADQINFRIRKVDASTGIISTIAGGGTMLTAPDGALAIDIVMKNPQDVLIDKNGDVIFSDENDERIRKINSKTGVLSTIAGTGYLQSGSDCVSPTSEGLNDPTGMSFDNTGDLYFCETSGHRVRKVFTATSINATIDISTPDNDLCVGASATFTAQVANGGSGAAYQWKVNGQPVGGNSPTYSSSFHDGDIVSCALNYTNTGACNATSTANSNNVTVRVSPLSVPAISISTPSSTICSGGNAEFTATAVAAGSSPVYQWLVNSNPAGGNTASYTATGLADNDVVQCRVTADPTASCTSVAAVTSAPVPIKVLSEASPVIQVTASAQQICPGDKVSFSAAVQNSGDSYSLQWLLNGNKVGENKDGYSNAVLRDGDVVICALTAGVGACMAGQEVNSNKTTISVRKLPVVVLGFTDTTVVPGAEVRLRAAIDGGAHSWQWSPPASVSDAFSLTPVTTPMVANTNFRLTVYSTEGCPTYKDAVIRVFYNLSMPNSFTPNGDGRNDVFRIPPLVTLELDEFAVFDRWGSRVFSTRNASVGWDGTWKGQACAPGVYVYVVKGKTIKGEVLTKGTVMLVR
ncbi:MAG TPA: gliding motility-associated C-terminal domain-containing protein [Puia sp.]